MFWTYSAPTIYVAEGASDEELCGSQENPCLSVDFAVTHMEPSADRRMVVWGIEHLQHSVDLSAVEVKGREVDVPAGHVEAVKLGAVTRSNADLLNGGIHNEDSLALSAVRFSLPPHLSTPFVFSSSKLQMQKVSFFHMSQTRSSSGLNYSLVMIARGTLQMTACAISDLATSCPLFSFGGGDGTDSNLIMLYSLNSSFANISNSNASPAFRRVDHCSSSLSFTMTQFLNCSSLAERGAVLCFSHSDRSLV
jgi:hypothetical protein